jgi:hypothetical protein
MIDLFTLGFLYLDDNGALEQVDLFYLRFDQIARNEFQLAHDSVFSA